MYATLFLGVYMITHAPGFTDDQGLLLGLFKIDPVDDTVHLFSGIAGVWAAWYSASAMIWYFRAVGILYGLDALSGLLAHRGLLDGSIFTVPGGSPDLSMTNWLINLPHIVIAGVALLIGFYWHRKLAKIN